MLRYFNYKFKMVYPVFCFCQKKTVDKAVIQKQGYILFGV